MCESRRRSAGDGRDRALCRSPSRALAVFSAPALKCGARDRWIGWDFGVQFGRLHLVTNNSRFLILPGAPRNLGSRVLSLCVRRLVRDWPACFGHEVLLAETFVDPARFRGTVYRAANWIEVGRTRGFARADGNQAHVLGIVGHDTKAPCGQKKSA